jgi:catechol 2,3-dioxygenase-like lactoylglutathione lyase family enzyme
MASRLLAVTFDTDDPRRLAQFWAGMLGRDVVETSGAATLPGDDTQVGLRFAPGPGATVEPNRLHLHLTSTDQASQDQTVAKALDLGGHHLDVGQLPEEQHVVLADPGGNPFCVIPPGNGFLAGCGFLGEVACEGSREVGLFWSEALGWPLVWDQDGETAIQSPLGGTKIAWGGPPVAAPVTPPRERFDLVAGGDARREIERLVSLGATRLDENTLVDPDGNEFRLHVAQH